MITKVKLKEYSSYKGDIDMYARTGNGLLTDAEWSIIDDLLQDWTIVKSGLASNGYILTLDKKIADNLDSEEAITYFKSIKSNL